MLAYAQGVEARDPVICRTDAEKEALSTHGQNPGCEAIVGHLGRALPTVAGRASSFARCVARFLCFASLLIPFEGPRATENDVDAAIVFAIDASSSIDVDAATRQRQGHAEALRSREVGRAISSGSIGCIAITYVEWSSAGNLRAVLPWTKVCNRDDADDAAEIIEQFGDRAIGRKVRGRTSLSYALDAGSLVLDRFPGTTARKIIDISANGTNNDGLPVAGSRLRTVAKGHVVNGIVMSRTEPGVESDLPAYFSKNVVGGPGSFVIVPDNPSAYATAIRRKLVLEISGLEPLRTERS